MYVSTIIRKPREQWIETWHSSSPRRCVEPVDFRVRESAPICISREYTFLPFLYQFCRDLETFLLSVALHKAR